VCRVTDSKDFAFVAGKQHTRLATAALIVALVIPLLHTVFRFVIMWSISTFNPSFTANASVIEGFVMLLLAVVAAVLAIMVLVRRSAGRGTGRGRAGVALGIAGVTLWNIGVGIAAGALLQFL
jgi:hypothetical protein